MGFVKLHFFKSLRFFCFEKIIVTIWWQALYRSFHNFSQKPKWLKSAHPISVQPMNTTIQMWATYIKLQDSFVNNIK